MLYLRICLLKLYLHVFIILSQFNITSAIWCSPKKEVTTQIDQLKVLNEVLLRCISQEPVSSVNKTDLSCPSVFDGLICWPATNAGTISKIQCPSYVHGFNTAGYAVKECLPNGEWFKHPILNTTFTNFTGCIPTGNEPVQYHPTIEELMTEHMDSIQILYRVGYGISLTFLVVAVFIMTMLSKLRCQRNIIHVNLFLSFIFRCIICFIKDEYVIPEDETDIMEESIRQITSSNVSFWCKFVHVLFFYFLVASYMWIFVEGIYLHTLIIITTFHNLSRRLFRSLIIFGWVSPVFCVLPWVIVRATYDDTLCWNIHSSKNGYFWILQGPVIATLLINFFLFVNIIRVLFVKLSASNTRDPKRYRKLAKATLVLIPLFGVYYIIFMTIPVCLDPYFEIVWMYTELTFSSFQGFIVSMLFCFLNNEVRNEIRKHWKRHMLRRQSLVSSRSTRTFSIQSSGSGREQGSPILNDKNKNDLLLFREAHSSSSITKEGHDNNISETELYQNSIQDDINLDVCFKNKNDNENMPFISGDKVSFF